MIPLSELIPGRHARIESVSGDPALVQRLYEFGLLEGEELEMVAVAPLGDPVEIRIGNTRLSLRLREAAGVSVSPL